MPKKFKKEMNEEKEMIMFIVSMFFLRMFVNTLKNP